MVRRPIVAAAAMLVIGLTIAACGSDDKTSSSTAASATKATQTTGKAGTEHPVVLAFISDTIPGVPLIDLIGGGVYAARDYINNELGGFGGRPLEIFTCDGKLDPAATRTCANRAVEKGAIGMVGLGINWGPQGLPVFSKAGIPSFNAPNTDQETKDPSAVGIIPGGRVEFAAGADYICKQGAKKVAVVSAGVADTKTAFEPAFQTWKNCGVDASFVGIPPTAADYSSFTQQAVKQTPDWIVVNFGPTQAGQVFKQLKASGWPMEKTMVTSGADDEKFLANAKVDGIYMTHEFDQNPEHPEVKTYFERMAKYSPKTEAAQGFGTWGFSEVMTVRNGAEKVGFDKVDGPGLLKFFKSPDSQGLPVFLGHPLSQPPSCCPAWLNPWAKVVQWKDGKFVDKVTQNDGWIQPLK